MAGSCEVSFSLTILCGFDLTLPQSTRSFSFQRRLRVRQVTLFKYALCLPISWFSEQALKQRHPSIQDATEKGSVHSMNATNLRLVSQGCEHNRMQKDLQLSMKHAEGDERMAFMLTPKSATGKSPWPSFNLTLLLHLPLPCPRETKLCPESNNFTCLKIRSICQDSPCCLLLASS